MTNKIQLQTALQKPYDRTLFSVNVLKPIFGEALTLNLVPVTASSQPTQKEREIIQSVVIYGDIALEDGTEVTCYEILLQPTIRIEQNKVAIQRYIRKLLIAGQIALVNFVSPQNLHTWRLTLVAKDSEITEKGVKEKFTHAKRYTYLLGSNETCKTAAERFESLSIETELTFQALTKAFSVEKLSEAFFAEYTLHYEKFCDYLQKSAFRQSVFNITLNDNLTQEETDKACKPIRDFVKKLMGRVVFLYFVQKKGWLGASDTEYQDGATDFIKQLFVQSGGDDSFYSGWLAKLFFETLNKERDFDTFDMPNGNKLKVPFLNGGLFDREKYDEAFLTLPATLFHHKEFEDNLLTKKNKEFSRGFFDFLDAFNFTIHEDSPDDHTVAVDPEMLGHIFENLLEDNKDKGAFYTPKEIVHYMCQESLIEYLTTHLSKEYNLYKEIGKTQTEIFGNESRSQMTMLENVGDKVLNREEVVFLVKNKEIQHLTNEQLNRINALLDTVKICDPAIGSGAFPMGLLQEIFAIKEVITYQLGEMWQPAKVKENIIQNCIYGVDIEKGAVDIARLRFWLSLVVDEQKPKPLPNLDYKIMQGNSLLESFEDLDLNVEVAIETELFRHEKKFTLKDIQQLRKLVAEYFSAGNSSAKKKLQNEIDAIVNKFITEQINAKIKQNEEKLAKVQESLILAEKPMPTKAADIEKKAKNIATLQKNLAKLLKEAQRLEEIKTQLKTMQKDRVYPYFLWHLWFSDVFVKKGFDIVIGNPPYGASLTDKDKTTFKKLYEEVHMRTPDTFNYFTAFAFQKLVRGEGTVSYIVPNNLFFQSEYEKTRKLLIQKNQLIKAINLGDGVFDTATVPSCIFVAQKNSKSTDYNFDFADLRNFRTAKIEFSEYITSQPITELLATPALVLGVSSKDFQILARIKSLSDTIDDIAYEVASGISTGGDKTFRISESLANELNLEKDLLFPVLVGGEIDKYAISDTKHQIIYTNRALDLKKYPNILTYLQPFKSKLLTRSEAKTGVMPWFSLNRQRYSELFTLPKILMRQTSDSIKATYDENKYFALDSILLYQTKPELETEIDYKFILAMLNSKINLFAYRNFTQEEGRTFAQVKPKNVRKLFVPKIDKIEQQPFIALVDYMLWLNANENPAASRYIDNKRMVFSFEKALNMCIYELYFAEEMKVQGIDVLQFADFKDISKENDSKRIAEIIGKAYHELQAEDSPIRNRIILAGVRNETITKLNSIV